MNTISLFQAFVKGRKDGRMANKKGREKTILRAFSSWLSDPPGTLVAPPTDKSDGGREVSRCVGVAPV